jgi:hypothetical protein
MPTIKKNVLKKSKKTYAHAKESKTPDAYINQMTEQEYIVFEIAKEHLQTSYDVTKSIGFREWQDSSEIKIYR